MKFTEENIELIVEWIVDGIDLTDLRRIAYDQLMEQYTVDEKAFHKLAADYEAGNNSNIFEIGTWDDET